MAKLTKAQQLYPHLVDFLISSPTKSFTVAQLARELMWSIKDETFDVLEMVNERTIREAAKLLPAACVTRSGSRLLLQSRGFARPAEFLAAWQRITAAAYPELAGDLNTPIIVNADLRRQLCHALVIPGDRELHQVIEWAQSSIKGIEVDFGYYGQTLRVRAA